MLAGIILLGTLRRGMNIGILGLSSAWAFILFQEEFAFLTIERLLPVRLLINIAGISLLFIMADSNGSLSRISQFMQSLARGRNYWLGLSVFSSIALLSAFGAGNIGSTAIAAAPAMKLAKDTGLSPFLMSLLVVGGANSTALSPFSMTGLLCRDLLIKQNIQGIDSLSWKVFFISFALIALVHLAGFSMLGGWAWSKKNHKQKEEPPLSLSLPQRATLSVLGLFLLILILSGMFHWSVLQDNIGLVALTFVCVLMISGLGDAKEGIKRIPWDTIILVGGMYALIALLEESGSLSIAEKLLGWSTQPWIIITFLALGASSLSAFTSSSGVVVPLFVPLLGGISVLHGEFSFLALLSIVLVAAHIVDSSPFSSLGALCIGSIGGEFPVEREMAFKQLLYWGLAMIPISIILANLIHLVL